MTETRQRDRRNPLTAMSARGWAAVALLALAIVFIVENRQSTRITVLVVTVTAPLWAALLASVVVGIVIGLLVAWRGRRL